VDLILVWVPLASDIDPRKRRKEKDMCLSYALHSFPGYCFRYTSNKSISPRVTAEQCHLFCTGRGRGKDGGISCCTRDGDLQVPGDVT